MFVACRIFLQSGSFEFLGNGDRRWPELMDYGSRMRAVFTKLFSRISNVFGTFDSHVRTCMAHGWLHITLLE